MPWQRVVAVDWEQGGLVLENQDGEQYAVPLLPIVEDRLRHHDVQVEYLGYPKGDPPRFRGWYMASPNDD